MCNLTCLVRCYTDEEMNQVIKSTEENIRTRIAQGKRTSIDIVELLMKQSLTELRR